MWTAEAEYTNDENATISDTGNMTALNTGNMTDLNTVNMTDLNIGNMTDLNTGNMTDLNIGNITDLNTGNMTDMNTGNMTDLNIGNMTDMNTGNMTDLNIGNRSFSRSSPGQFFGPRIPIGYGYPKPLILCRADQDPPSTEKLLKGEASARPQWDAAHWSAGCVRGAKMSRHPLHCALTTPLCHSMPHALCALRAGTR